MYIHVIIRLCKMYTYSTRILYNARSIAICVDMAECKFVVVVVAVAAVELLEELSYHHPFFFLADDDKIIVHPK